MDLIGLRGFENNKKDILIILNEISKNQNMGSITSQILLVPDPDAILYNLQYTPMRVDLIKNKKMLSFLDKSVIGDIL